MKTQHFSLQRRCNLQVPENVFALFAKSAWGLQPTGSGLWDAERRTRRPGIRTATAGVDGSARW